jgi:hypothetical protein
LEGDVANTETHQKLLAQVALKLRATLLSLQEGLLSKIGTTAEEIRRIEQLSPLSEAAERARALKATAANQASAAQKLERIRSTAGFAGLGAPILMAEAWLALRRARAVHLQSEQEFDEPSAKARRAEQIANHNRLVASEQARLSTLRPELDTCRAKHAAVTDFSTSAADAISAAQGDGWLAVSFPAQFQDMATRVQSGDIRGAATYLPRLAFQRKPADAAYASWKKEAIDIRERTYARYGGMAASGSYAEIAAKSIKLSESALQEPASGVIEQFVHPADQWQVLSTLLTDPRQLKVDALWAVYWAMFQCGEWVAEALSEADANEDLFTGKLSAQIDRWLSDWAAKHVQGFGYPDIASYMGTLEIAGTTEETRLGADIGVIVDLQLGELVCRKVALFQAKKVKFGIADIGSKSGQLAALAASPSMGFYLFYHQSTYPLRAPAPTVCNALGLAELIKSGNRSVEAPHLNLNVRTVGWDWASFITFGLCQPDSGIGEPFSTAENALKKLGGGDARNLPKYLHVIAIADEPRVLALRQYIHQHYRNIQQSLDKSNYRSGRLAPGRDAPEQGMSR